MEGPGLEREPGPAPPQPPEPIRFGIDQILGCPPQQSGVGETAADLQSSGYETDYGPACSLGAYGLPEASAGNGGVIRVPAHRPIPSVAVHSRPSGASLAFPWMEHSRRLTKDRMAGERRSRLGAPRGGEMAWPHPLRPKPRGSGAQLYRNAQQMWGARRVLRVPVELGTSRLIPRPGDGGGTGGGVKPRPFEHGPGGLPKRADAGTLAFASRGVPRRGNGQAEQSLFIQSRKSGTFPRSCPREKPVLGGARAEVTGHREAAPRKLLLRGLGGTRTAFLGRGKRAFLSGSH